MPDVDARPDEDQLLLGPLLRWVGENAATVWVQTAECAIVTIRVEGQAWSAPTFTVHGLHYALVICDGLASGTTYPYAVEIDGEQVWPRERDLERFPEPSITTIVKAQPAHLIFGSCRTSGPHDEATNEKQGVDALRALALALAHTKDFAWPDLLVLLGDQIYADNPPQEFIDKVRHRRDVNEPPGEEVKDYVEYDWLYRIAWTEPAVRWLLSTVPSAMIFDDHDVRDDWNTSWPWKQEMAKTSWWPERIQGALASYWVYQHCGNLAPDELAADPIWQLIAAGDNTAAHDTTDVGAAEVDVTEALDTLAADADRDPTAYRWSHTRDLGESRLIMIDTRAARDLQPRVRGMLDPEEMDWLDSQMRGDVEHLFIGTSLPFLLPPGLHDFEALSEVVAERGWGERSGKIAERVRQRIDLEHWAAFHSGFAEVFEMVMAVARGERGQPPHSITFLSGDVHNSYVAQVTDPQQYAARSNIVQAVCSPMRNPMPYGVRVMMSLFAKGLVRPMRFIASKSARVPDPLYPWTVTLGPWFDNNVATLEVVEDGIQMRWLAGLPTDADSDPPMREVAEVTIPSP